VTLNDLKNQMAKECFGMTKAEAHAQQICISCQKPIGHPAFHTAADVVEYRISGLCPKCFDHITAEQEE
jgi:hypothetical protein